MSGAELAGRLVERVTVSRRSDARDAMGSEAAWVLAGSGWAEVRPEKRGPAFVGEALSALPLWRVTMRAGGLQIGDRIGWGARSLIVRELIEDPALPDRIVGIGEEER